MTHCVTSTNPGRDGLTAPPFSMSLLALEGEAANLAPAEAPSDRHDPPARPVGRAFKVRSGREDPVRSEEVVGHVEGLPDHGPGGPAPDDRQLATPVLVVQ